MICKLRDGIRILLIAFILITTTINTAAAASATEIDIKVDAALRNFTNNVPAGGEFLKKAVGVLAFPSVIKAGFGIGGEYGEGALRVGGKSVDYYSTAAASIGFQIGAQSKTVILVFLEHQALDEFRRSEGWKAGVDGSVAVVKWGVGGDINTTDIKDPIVGFVFNNKGLMYNLTLEGAKFTKLVR